MHISHGDGDGPGRHEQHAHAQQRKAGRRKGQHGAEKIGGGQGKTIVEKKILRIANRRGHAAEIGRDGLQYDDVRSIGGSIGHVQNQDGKGDEGEQGYIIGDEHGTEKRQQHQHERQKTQCLFTAKQAQRQRLEQTAATQPGHDGHQAEKQAQHAEVEIGNIRRGGRHKKSGGQRGQRRAAENGLPADKVQNAGGREMHGVRFLS